MNPRAIAAIGVVLVLCLAGCTKKQGTQQEQPQQGQAQTQTQRPMDTLRPAHHFVSYYKLLARPEDYEGKRIQVLGVLSISSEDNAASLYPNMESFHHQVRVDSLSLGFTSEQWKRFVSLHGRFVAIEGTFKRIAEADEYSAAGAVAPATRLVDFTDYYR